MSKARSIGPAGMALTALMGRPSLIRSIQYDTVSVVGGTATGTKAINPVDVQNAFVISLGDASAFNIASAENYAILSLASALVTATRIGVNATGLTSAFVVVELEPGVARSVQPVSVPILNTATSGTVALTSVTPEKTILLPRGRNSSDTAGNALDVNARTALTSPILLTSTRLGVTGNLTIGITAVELF